MNIGNDLVITGNCSNDRIYVKFLMTVVALQAGDTAIQ